MLILRFKAGLLLAFLLTIYSCSYDSKKGDDSSLITGPTSPAAPSGPSLSFVGPAFINGSTAASFTVSGSCSGDALSISGDLAGASVTTDCISNVWTISNIDLSGLSDGAYTISLTATDSSGQTVSFTENITKDVIAPVISNDAIAIINNSNASSYTLSGACSADDEIISGTIGSTAFSATCTSSVWAAIGINLSTEVDGTLAINISALDGHQNVGNILSANILKDTINPSLSIDTPAIVTSNNQGAYSLTGSCSEEGETINGSVDSVNFSVSCTTSLWNSGVLDLTSLGEGSLTISISGADSNGNTGTASDTVLKDITAPTLTIDTTRQINQSNHTAYIASGTCSEEGQAVNGLLDVQNFVSVCTGGTWSSTPKDLSFLSDGNIAVSIQGVDTYGNDSGNVSDIIVKDTTAPLPQLSFVTPASGYGSTQSVTIRVASILAADTVKAFDNANCTNQIASEVSAGTSHDLVFTNSGEGQYSYYFVVESGGNPTSCLGPLVYTEDQTAPVSPTNITLSSPGNGETSNDATPLLGGDLANEEGSTVTAYRDGACTLEIGNTIIENGQFTVIGTLPIDGSADGLNQFYLKVTDQAGNQSTCINTAMSYTLGGTGLASMPKLAMVGSNSPSSIISLENANAITLKDSAGVTKQSTTLEKGQVVTWNVNQGDRIESSGACYAVTQGYGTAPWASLAYAGTVFTSFISRYGAYTPKIIIASVEGSAFVQLKQDGNTLAYANVGLNAIHEFNINLTDNKPILITSTKKINAYFVSRSSGSGTYDKDARVLTPAATEVIGYAGYITAASDGTTGNYYQQNATTGSISLNTNQYNYFNRTMYGDIGWASIVKADKPISLTQIADGNGTNASPHLPLTMLSTMYGIPRPADYVAFASPSSGTVSVYAPDGTTLVGTYNLTRAGGAPADAPYSYKYDPGTTPAGTTFVCSSPCYAYYDDTGSGADKDETLMMGFNP